MFFRRDCAALTLVLAVLITSANAQTTAQCEADCPGAQVCQDNLTDRYRTCGWTNPNSNNQFNLPATATNVFFTVTGGSGGGATPDASDPANGAAVGYSIQAQFTGTGVAQTFGIYNGQNGGAGSGGISFMGGTMNGGGTAGATDGFGGGSASVVFLGGTGSLIVAAGGGGSANGVGGNGGLNLGEDGANSGGAGGGLGGETNPPTYGAGGQLYEAGNTDNSALLSAGNAGSSSGGGASATSGVYVSGAGGGGAYSGGSGAITQDGLAGGGGGGSSSYNTNFVSLIPGQSGPDGNGVPSIYVQFTLPETNLPSPMLVGKLRARRREARRNRVLRENRLMA